MELQMIKKAFYRAVFENATTQGFQQSTTNYKRTAAKRGSFMAQRPKNEVYQPQVGGNALGLPQFGGSGPNANKMEKRMKDPVMGGGMDVLTRPPKRKPNQNKPPPNPMINQPPPNPMKNKPPSNPMANKPPPNPMINQPPPNPMKNKPPSNPMANKPPPNP
eukprot:359732_1